MAEGQSDGERAIRAGSDAFVRAATAGDAEGMVQAYYAEGAYLIAPGTGIMRGPRQAAEVFRGMLEAGVGDVAIETLEIGASGDMAYRVGHYTEGRPAPGGGRFLEVWRKHADGAWRCVADMFDGEQPPG